MVLSGIDIASLSPQLRCGPLRIGTSVGPSCALMTWQRIHTTADGAARDGGGSIDDDPHTGTICDPTVIRYVWLFM